MSRRRRLTVLGLLAVLALLSGCTAIFGPGEPDPQRLGQNATYDWETDTRADIVVNKSSFEGVYDLKNRSRIAVYSRDELGRERPLRVEAVKYRYDNGTVVPFRENRSTITVTRTRTRTVIDVPNGTTGKVAFTAPRQGKRFTVPVFLEGSYEVTLPPNARVGVPLLSQVSPGDYETSVSDGRMTVRWEEVTTRSIAVRYYLQRDLLLFSSLVVLAIAIGSTGALYYYRQIQRLKRRREEHGLDVDEDDDPRDRGPPPGMG